MYISNSAPLMPNHIAPGFQPARNVMQMVNTINNRLAAARTDSFTENVEMEQRVRMMMLEEEEKGKAGEALPPQGWVFERMSPFQTQSKKIASATQLIGESKAYVDLIKKHEAVLADENSSAEQRASSQKSAAALKEHLEGIIEGTLYFQGVCINIRGSSYNKKNPTDETSKLLKDTGDISMEALGLTGFESLNSDEILKKLDGALAHLNKMGKSLNPGYVPPDIVPLSQKDIDWFENLAENWDYIVQKYGHLAKQADPIPDSTFSATA